MSAQFASGSVAALAGEEEPDPLGGEPAAPEVCELLRSGGLVTDPELRAQVWKSVGLNGYSDIPGRGWSQNGRAMVPLRGVLAFRCESAGISFELVEWRQGRHVRVTGLASGTWYFPLAGGNTAYRDAEGVVSDVTLDPPAKVRDGTLFVPLRFLIQQFAVAADVEDAAGQATVYVFRLEPDLTASVGLCSMRPLSKPPPPPKAPDPAQARATIVRWLDACKAHNWDTVDKLTPPGGHYFLDLVSYSLLGRRKGEGWYSQEIRATARSRLGLAFTAAQWVTATWDWETERWLVTIDDDV